MPIFMAFGELLPLSIPMKFQTTVVSMFVPELKQSIHPKLEFQPLQIAYFRRRDPHQIPHIYDLMNGPPEGWMWIVVKNKLRAVPAFSRSSHDDMADGSQS